MVWKFLSVYSTNSPTSFWISYHRSTWMTGSPFWKKVCQSLINWLGVLNLVRINKGKHFITSNPKIAAFVGLFSSSIAQVPFLSPVYFNHWSWEGSLRYETSFLIVWLRSYLILKKHSKKCLLLACRLWIISESCLRVLFLKFFQFCVNETLDSTHVAFIFWSLLTWSWFRSYPSSYVAFDGLVTFFPIW